MFDPDKNENRPRDVRELDAYQEYERGSGSGIGEKSKVSQFSDAFKYYWHKSGIVEYLTT